MRQSQLEPPKFTRQIGLNDQIYFFYTGEMSRLGAEAAKERAKERLKDLFQEKIQYTKRLEFYKEKIKSDQALGKLEKAIQKEMKPIERRIERMKKFILDVKIPNSQA